MKNKNLFILGVLTVACAGISLMTFFLADNSRKYNLGSRASGLNVMASEYVVGAAAGWKAASLTQPLTVSQDLGYMLRYQLNGNPISGVPLEVSMKTASGWTNWSDFKNGNQWVMPINGVTTIDFSRWPKVPPADYIAKFRIKGQTAESNTVFVKVRPADLSSYFPFSPGNYWIFKGCLVNSNLSNNNFNSCPPGQIYQVRFDAENEANVSISYQGKTYN